MQSPHVSVILPSYNYARYLSEAVESVISQTYQKWELLIIDDGSQDNSACIAREYAACDPRIRFLRHPDGGNHGLAATLCLGLQEAQYAIVAFLESDDVWKSNALAKRLPLMCEHGTALVFNAPELRIAQGRDATYIHFIMQILDTVVAHRTPPSVFAHEQTVINLIPTFSCVMADKNLLLDCDFESPIAPLLDKWLWQQMALKGVCRFLPEPLTAWRLHMTSYMYASHKDAGPREGKEWRARTHEVLTPHVRGHLRARLALCMPALNRLWVRCWMKTRTQGMRSLWWALRRKRPRW